MVPPHIWIGASIEDQAAMFRLEQLSGVFAETRFLSCEPLLGPLDFPGNFPYWVDWVIVGGESGVGYRPMDAEWARGIRDRCNADGIAFFFKQWGGRTPKAGGRELDGRTWDEMPHSLAAEVVQ